MNNIAVTYYAILKEARKIFEEESRTNECDWRILRLLPVIEKLNISMKKIEELSSMRTDFETKVLIKNQFLNILNYAVIFLIQCKYRPVTTKSDMSVAQALVHYDDVIKMSKNQNHSRPDRVNEIGLDIWIDSIYELIKNININLSLKVRGARERAQYASIQIINHAAFAGEVIMN